MGTGPRGATFRRAASPIGSPSVSALRRKKGRSREHPGSVRPRRTRTAPRAPAAVAQLAGRHGHPLQALDLLHAHRPRRAARRVSRAAPLGAAAQGGEPRGRQPPRGRAGGAEPRRRLHHQPGERPVHRPHQRPLHPGDGPRAGVRPRPRRPARLRQTGRRGAHPRDGARRRRRGPSTRRGRSGASRRCSGSPARCRRRSSRATSASRGRTGPRWSGGCATCSRTPSPTRWTTRSCARPPSSPRRSSRRGRCRRSPAAAPRAPPATTT